MIKLKIRQKVGLYSQFKCDLAECSLKNCNAFYMKNLPILTHIRSDSQTMRESGQNFSYCIANFQRILSESAQKSLE